MRFYNIFMRDVVINLRQNRSNLMEMYSRRNYSEIFVYLEDIGREGSTRKFDEEKVNIEGFYPPPFSHLFRVDRLSAIANLFGRFLMAAGESGKTEEEELRVRFYGIIIAIYLIIVNSLYFSVYQLLEEINISEYSEEISMVDLGIDRSSLNRISDIFDFLTLSIEEYEEMEFDRRDIERMDVLLNRVLTAE